MKKACSPPLFFLMGLLVCWSILPASASTLLLGDGFETVEGSDDLVNGPYPNPLATLWTVTGDEKGIAVYTAEAGLPIYKGDQSLRVKHYIGTTIALTGSFAPQKNEIVEAGMAFYLPEMASGRILTLTMRQSESSNTGPHVALSATDGLGYFDRDNVFHKLADIAFDQWITLSIVVDMTKKSYYIVYNDVAYLQATGIAFYRNINNVANLGLTVSSGATFYLDDVFIRTVPEPSWAHLAFCGAMLSLVHLQRKRRRKAGRMLPFKRQRR